MTSVLAPKTDSRVLFVDMNSFFASCEQQTNYWLRGRPVGVCVYTGKFGCVIAPSIEAKRKGVKTGMRLNEAIRLCPDLVPLETNPSRYRDFHVKIIKVLRKYSQDVIPKSIDEAIVNLNNYGLIHQDVVKVAHQIKKDITNEVGDWLKCSIGIAPNAFLAKLASDIQKPDGLTIITPQNIDEVLSKLKLTDLPGIGGGMAARLQRGGITTPLQIRHSSPENLRAICRSVIGLYWYHRLNFSEVDISKQLDYKSMQAMRHLSQEQRKSTAAINEILFALCITLERRMVQRNMFCQTLGFAVRYANGDSWGDSIQLSLPMQDGGEILNAVESRIKHYEQAHNGEKIINSAAISINVYVSNFLNEDMVQYNLFENNEKKDKLRKTVYELKGKYGKDSVLRAVEVKEGGLLSDVIGFGSVKDLHDEESFRMDL